MICGKGKIGYLDGILPKPSSDDPSYPEWDVQNSMVMAWLTHSMEEKISDTYLFYSNAKGMWDRVHLAYLDLENPPQMLELRNRARNLRQGKQDVTQCFNSLIKLWQELDLFNTCEWKDPKDAVMFQETVERDQVIHFLDGLNNDLDDVRGRIASMKPLTSIEETFAVVPREESLS